MGRKWRSDRGSGWRTQTSPDTRTELLFCGDSHRHCDGLPVLFYRLCNGWQRFLEGSERLSAARLGTCRRRLWGEGDKDFMKENEQLMRFDIWGTYVSNANGFNLFAVWGPHCTSKISAHKTFCSLFTIRFLKTVLHRFRKPKTPWFFRAAEVVYPEQVLSVYKYRYLVAISESNQNLK